MGCTSRATREKRGCRLDCGTRDKLPGSWWIPAMQTACLWRRWDTRTDRTRTAAFFAQKMEACTGKKCCFTTKIPARSTWRLSQAIRKRFTPRCGRRAGPPGAFIHPRTAQEAACIVRMTAEITGSWCRDKDYPRMDWGAWASHLRPAIRSGFTLLSTPNRAGYTVRMIADRLGSKSQKTTGFGGGAGTSMKLP